MGEAVLGVVHLDRNKAHCHAAPVQAHHDLDVEIHPLAESALLKQRAARLDRIDAKAAHAVLDLEGERLNPDPDVSQVAAVEAPLWHRFIVFGGAGDERLREAL